MKKVYMLLLFCCLGFAASAVTEYKPSGTSSFTGAAGYCQSATASPLVYTYSNCSSGTGVDAGTSCVIRWYYNPTNTTTITGSTVLVSGPIPFTSAIGPTGTQSYTPSTATNGTYYYFCVISWTGASIGCGGASGSITSPTQLVTVATTAPVTGPSAVCVTKTVTMSDATPGGTWSTSNPSVATVDAAGVVTGVAPGAVFVIYTANGCASTAIISVNGNPAPITPLAGVEVCEGATTTLSNTTPSGTWSIAPGTIAGISTSGVVNGILAGTATVTYTIASGCNSTKVVTVTPLPTPIAGTTSVCMGSTTTLSSTPVGGSWISSTPAVATVGSGSGIVSGVTAGVATISYLMASGCRVTATVMVGTPPGPITAADSSICAGGDTVTYVDTVLGGTWSSSSGNASVSTAGLVTGVTAGTAIISYTTPGCAPATKNVTVDALPSAITGIPKVCNGQTTTLYNTTAGGIWTSSDTFKAKVDTLTGVGSTNGFVHGISMGTATITYRMAAGCQVTTTVTVNPLGPVTGDDTVCQGSVTYFTNIVGGGTWSSSNPLIANVDVTTGAITGLVPGISYIVYLLPTGCTNSRLVTVWPPMSAISGALSVCSGSTTTLGNAMTGGTWTSSNGFVASIGSSSGIVLGSFPDTAVVTYTKPHGCVATAIVTVNPVPSPTIVYNAMAHTLTTGSFATYQWFNGVTGVIPGATNAVLTSVNGNSYYSVTVTDANGCQGSATWYGAVNVNNYSAADIRVYPNPATDVVNIESPMTVKAVISGIEGKVMAEFTDAKSINIGSLPNGLYLLSLYNDSGEKLTTQKLLKQ